MRYRIKKVLITLTAIGVTGAALSGCGEGGAAKGAETEDAKVKESESPSPRLVVASEKNVDVVEASSLKSLDRFALKSRPKLAVAGDDRHVFAMLYGSGQVNVVDTGSWTEAHGDHGHSYTTTPSLRKTVIKGDTTYHSVSDDERSVVWFDGEGAFVSFDWKGLANDNIDTNRIEAGAPHHGVGVPLKDGGYLASVAEGDHAVGVAVLDASGKETKRIGGCPGLHGEAHVDEDAYAFGCDTGVLIVDEGRGTSITSPMKGAGTGALAGTHESEVLVGDLRSDSDKAAATKLALYDLEAKKAKAVDLGVEYSSFVRQGEKSVVVMGTDGKLHLIDVESGAETRKIDAVDAWTKTDDWEVPVPQLAIAGHTAYVTDPEDKSLIAIDLETGRETGRTTLTSVPTSLAVTNAPHDH